MNQGKGRALKTAFETVLLNCHDCEGDITIDADGQHDLTSINRVLDLFSRLNRV